MMAASFLNLVLMQDLTAISHHLLLGFVPIFKSAHSPFLQVSQHQMHNSFAHKFAQIFTAADCDLVGAIKTGKL